MGCGASSAKNVCQPGMIGFMPAEHHASETNASTLLEWVRSAEPAVTQGLLDATRAALRQNEKESNVDNLKPPQSKGEVDLIIDKFVPLLRVILGGKAQNTSLPFVDERQQARAKTDHKNKTADEGDFKRIPSAEDILPGEHGIGRAPSAFTFCEIHRLASEAVQAAGRPAEFELPEFQKTLSQPTSVFMNSSEPRSIQGFLETTRIAANLASTLEGGEHTAFHSEEHECEDQNSLAEDNFQSVKMALSSLAGSGHGNGMMSFGLAIRPRRQKLPDPKTFDRTTCLFFDIVSFSNICAQRTSGEVGAWLLRVHEIVEAHMRQHAIQIVEIRGDCYICLSGTRHVPGDLPETQVSRMVAFACAMQQELSAHVNTPVRIGIATGSVTVGYIRANNSSFNVCAYGDCVNMAARMEQNGREGRVLLTIGAAQQLREERSEPGAEDAAPRLPVRMTNVKGKGLLPTAWVDCATRNFVHDPQDPIPASSAKPARRCSFPPSSRGADVTVDELLATHSAP